MSLRMVSPGDSCIARPVPTLVLALIGSLLLKEPQGGRRIIAAALVVAGVVLLRP